MLVCVSVHPPISTPTSTVLPLASCCVCVSAEAPVNGVGVLSALNSPLPAAQTEVKEMKQMLRVRQRSILHMRPALPEAYQPPTVCIIAGSLIIVTAIPCTTFREHALSCSHNSVEYSSYYQVCIIIIINSVHFFMAGHFPKAACGTVQPVRVRAKSGETTQDNEEDSQLGAFSEAGPHSGPAGHGR